MNLTQARDAIDDGALRRRLTTAAYARGIDNPEAWVSGNIGKLVTQVLPGNAEGQALADVRAYSAGQREQQQQARDAYMAAAPAVVEPSDPTYLTDAMLIEAVDLVAGNS